MKRQQPEIPPRVADAIERAIMRSFETRPMRGKRITQNEVRRRFVICEEIWRALRIEQGRSIVYICDHLYSWLTDIIDKKPFNPSTRDTWIVKK